MDKALQQRVRQRAGNACEYCRLPQIYSRFAFAIDHIIARQHGGTTTEDNLAFACPICNRHKGPNLSGVDPVTRQITRLFHPRQDLWNAHFRWNGPVLLGITEIGRATVAVLAMNDDNQLIIRSALVGESRFP